MNRMVRSGLLYRSFSHTEIQKIQPCTVFFSVQTGQFVANKISLVKANDDFQDAMNFANFLESECQKHIDTIRFLKCAPIRSSTRDHRHRHQREHNPHHSDRVPPQR